MDKVFRCDDLSPHIEAGRVYVSENVPDIHDMMNEAKTISKWKA